MYTIQNLFTLLVLVELVNRDIADFKVSEVFLEVRETHVELSVLPPHVITLKKLLTTSSWNVLPRRGAGERYMHIVKYTNGVVGNMIIINL